MRTTLLIPALLCILLLTFTNKRIYGQACSVTNITVRLNSANSSGGSCQINFDLSWDQSNNSGNKYTTLHLWTTANYPVPPLTYASAPTAAELANAVGTIVIKDPTLATPTLNPTYQNAPTAIILPATGIQKVYVSGTGNNTINRFTITGITTTLASSCSNSITLKADIWSSNANSNNGVQCTSLGNPFIVNDPTVNGAISCALPRQFTVTISSVSTITQPATYTVYTDLAPVGTLDASDPVIFTSGPIVIPANNIPYNAPAEAIPSNLNSSLWVRVQVTGQPFSTTELLANICPLLPVTLTYFSAQRSSAIAVLLKWETTMELNNQGFEIHRKTDGRDFQKIAFVPSQATNGNSQVKLTYEFADANTTTATSQYRLAQVDLDGRQTFSNIVLAKGQGGSALTALIYPNPSPNGQVAVVLNSSDRKDLQLTDSQGRLLHRFSGTNESQFNFRDLKAGIYFLKVVDQRSGEKLTEKILVR